MRTAIFIWQFILISDDLGLLLCAFAMWYRNRGVKDRTVSLLAPMFAAVVLYSLERTLAPLMLMTRTQFQAAIGIVAVSSSYLIITTLVRTIRSFYCWRFSLYALGIINGISHERPSELD